MGAQEHRERAADTARRHLLREAGKVGRSAGWGAESGRVRRRFAIPRRDRVPPKQRPAPHPAFGHLPQQAGEKAPWRPPHAKPRPRPPPPPCRGARGLRRAISRRPIRSFPATSRRAIRSRSQPRRRRSTCFRRRRAGRADDRQPQSLRRALPRLRRRPDRHSHPCERRTQRPCDRGHPAGARERGASPPGSAFPATRRAAATPRRRSASPSWD